MPVQSLTSSLATVSGIGIHCWCSHSPECMKAAPLQHAVRCSVTRQWYVPFDADFCDFLVYLLVTDKAVQLDRGFRHSSRSRVFRYPSVPSRGQYCPFDDTSLEIDWCFGNSILFGNSLAIRLPVHLFSVKHATITAKSSFESHFNQISKYVIYIIRFLADRTNGRAIGTVLRLSSVVCNTKYCG